MIDNVIFHFTRAQARMKEQAYKHRSNKTNMVGDWVWLKLLSYRQQSVQKRVNKKMSYKSYGPFLILAVIGKVTYKLQIPEKAATRNVFHISQLEDILW